MINTPVIICSNVNELFSNIKFENNDLIYAYVINSLDSFDKLSLERIHNNEYFNNTKLCFSLYFDFSNEGGFLKEIINNNKELILQYFFHPNYKILYNKPLLFFNSKDAERQDVQEVLSELQNYIVSQGYESPQAIFFTNTFQSDRTNDILFNTTDSLNHVSLTYYNLLINNYCGRFVGLYIESASIVLRELIAVEHLLLKENEICYNHLIEFQQLKLTSLQLLENLKLTKEDLSNQKQYLKIYKDQDESLKINEFYHNEYEILPLWYKKLGHIIKVMMGKRTFRSLFDNNVNKYKD